MCDIKLRLVLGEKVAPVFLHVSQSRSEAMQNQLMYCLESKTLSRSRYLGHQATLLPSLSHCAAINLVKILIARIGQFEYL